MNISFLLPLGFPDMFSADSSQRDRRGGPRIWFDMPHVNIVFESTDH